MYIVDHQELSIMEQAHLKYCCLPSRMEKQKHTLIVKVSAHISLRKESLKATANLKWLMIINPIIDPKGAALMISHTDLR